MIDDDVNDKRPIESLVTMAESAAKRLQIEVQDDALSNEVTVHLTGRLDIFTFRSLAEQVDARCKDRQGVHLIVDLRGVPFVASSGWSAFIAVRGRLKRQEGHLTLVGMSEELKRVFFAMKLNDLIPAYNTLAELKVLPKPGKD